MKPLTSPKEKGWFLICFIFFTDLCARNCVLEFYSYCKPTAMSLLKHQCPYEHWTIKQQRAQSVIGWVTASEVRRGGDTIPMLF